MQLNLTPNIKYFTIVIIFLCLNITAWWLFIAKDKQKNDPIEIFVSDEQALDKQIDVEENWLKIAPELSNSKTNNKQIPQETKNEEPTQKASQKPTQQKAAQNNNQATDFNDYLIDLYNKISTQNKEIAALKKKISLAESRSQINNAPGNTDNMSLLLIELYRIKNIAYLGHEFGSKIKNIYPLAANVSLLKENLIKLKAINKLPKISSTKKLIYKLEREIIKQHQQTQKKGITSSIKIALRDLVKIKQIKELDKNSIMYRFIQLEEAFQSENYATAYQYAMSFEFTSRDLISLQKDLKVFNDFAITFDNSLAVIFNIKP